MNATDATDDTGATNAKPRSKWAVNPRGAVDGVSVLDGALTPERAWWLLKNRTEYGGELRYAFRQPSRGASFRPDPQGITAEEYAHADRVWGAFDRGTSTLTDAIGAIAVGVHPNARFGIDDLPDGDFLATDWPTSTTVSPREVAIKYIAIYGPREYPWRVATPAEVAEMKHGDTATKEQRAQNRLARRG